MRGLEEKNGKQRNRKEMEFCGAIYNKSKKAGSSSVILVLYGVLQ
jgi:hypothetical protein